MALAQFCLNTSAIFSSCPRRGGNQKGQGYLPVGGIYHQTRLGNISVPAESSRCLREEGAAPCSDELLHPLPCSTLQVLLSAPDGERRGQRLKPLQGLLFSAVAQAWRHITQQHRRTIPPSSMLPPPSPAAALKTLDATPTVGCMWAGSCVSADLIAQLWLMPANIGIFLSNPASLATFPGPQHIMSEIH